MNSQPPGHDSDMLTTEPPGRGFQDGMNGIYLYFVNKLFLVGRYWDYKNHKITKKKNFLMVFPQPIP